MVITDDGFMYVEILLSTLCGGCHFMIAILSLFLHLFIEFSSRASIQPNTTHPVQTSTSSDVFGNKVNNNFIQSLCQ